MKDKRLALGNPAWSIVSGADGHTSSLLAMTVLRSPTRLVATMTVGRTSATGIGKLKASTTLCYLLCSDGLSIL